MTWLYFKYICDEDWEQIERTDEKNVKRLLNIYKYKEDYPKLAEYTAMWDTFYFGATSKKFIKAFHYAFESYDFDALSPLLNTLNEDQGIYEAAKNRRTIRLYPLSCTRHFLDRESSPADIT